MDTFSRRSQASLSHSIFIGTGLLALCAITGVVQGAPGNTQLISFNATNTGPGRSPSTAYVCQCISADGRYVAFSSDARNLVSGDTNNHTDIFVRDRRTGKTKRVNVSSSGAQANGHSAWPSMSSDGRYIAFSSGASTLVPGDTNSISDIFVHDRITGETVRVSETSDGREASGILSAISGNGRTVVFKTSARNLTGTDLPISVWIVRDLDTGINELVSVNSAGTMIGNTGTGGDVPAISPDGQIIAFPSVSRLTSDDSNDAADIFVRDRKAQRTELVSVTSAGQQGDYDAFNPSMSADGRYIAFASDTLGVPISQVFVRDRQARTTQRASKGFASGEPANDASYFGFLSQDGRYVAFQSYATNLIPNDTNDVSDIFVRDRKNGHTKRVSVSSTATQSNGDSFFPTLSGDGRFVVFSSAATNLISGDTNEGSDVFVHENAVAAPSFSLSPTSINFGNQKKGTSSAPRTVQLMNTGTGLLAIRSIALGGPSPGEYSKTTTCGASLGAGKTCQINVVFKPLANGTKNANLIFYTGSFSRTVPLTGVGVN